MPSPKRSFLNLFLAAAAGTLLACAQSTVSKAEPLALFKTTQTQRCIEADGLPDHPTGTFPNRGNPNAIEAQDIELCVPLSPTKAEVITPIRGTMGVAVNGVQFRPNTAGFYDPEARRGHSRNGDKDWSLDIHGAPGKLGLDFNNAHVGRGGLYHYHGIASSLTDTSGSSLIGYAGDGFEMHYVGEAVKSGYQLREGERLSGPGGAYDGTYNEDYIYVGGEGRLDECNGGEQEGRYVYFVTESYPFVPRCLIGHVSADFNKPNHRTEGRRGGETGGERRGERRNRP